MISGSKIHQNLYRLYEHYVGEPDSSSDVYGYWLFIVGYLVAAAGVLIFVISYAGDTGSYYLIRISTVIAGTGGSIGLFGLVLMLPVRKRAIQASMVGLVIALVGVVFSAAAYPYHWRGHGMDLTVEGIVITAIGVGTLGGVALLVPAVTGQRGKFVEEEGQTEDPPILTGDALESAQFAVFRDEKGDWRWNVLHLEALAGSTDSAVTRPNATEGIERVKSQISSAGLMELTTSAFRLYEDRDETWQWTLAREDGSVVGTCSREFDHRDDAEQSVSFLKDRGPSADVIEIEGAAFTYVQERDKWFWRLIDDARTPLATGETGHRSQKRAEDAARTFAERFERARVLDVESVGAELYERNGGWTWRLVDGDDDVLATAEDEFDARRDAEAAIETLLPEFDSTSITVAGEPKHELYQTGEEWQFRLVDETERVVVRNPDGLEEHAEAKRRTEQFSEGAGAADVAEIEDAEYEVYPVDDGQELTFDGSDDLPSTADGKEVTADGGVVVEEADEDEPEWNWRLVTDGREIVAASDEPHSDPEAAATAIERVRQQASEADLIEFENAAFQVYEADSGEWRWRLIDEDGNVLADSGTEHTTRTEASQAMMTLKEEAPEAELLEIETAAFELFVDENDEWGWRLIDEGGKLVAEDPATHPTREAARAAMDRLLEHLDSDVRTMDAPIFQPYVDEDWHWRFVLPNGDTVAVNAEAYPTRDDLVDQLVDVREAATSAKRYVIGDVIAQLYGTDEWRFRLLDRDRETIADSNDSYPDRKTAREVVATITDHADDAPVFTIEDAVVRLESDDGWTWSLVDRDRNAIGRSTDPTASKDDLVSTVETVRQLAPRAGRVDFDVASFELVADEDDRWRWRLIDENGRSVASGSETYATTDAAREAVADVRDLIEAASILEIDSVSFELHAAEDDDGWVWHLIDEHGETMAESTQIYESRTDAREAMNAVKAHAPDGWITFTE